MEKKMTDFGEAKIRPFRLRERLAKRSSFPSLKITTPNGWSPVRVKNYKIKNYKL